MSVYHSNYLPSPCLTSHDMTLHLFSERSVKILSYVMVMRYSTTQDEGGRAKGFAHKEKTDNLATL
jgi:hypothetical protein